MGVERLLPRFFAAVHRRFRTPYLALLCIVAVVALGGTALALGLALFGSIWWRWCGPWW